MALFAPSTRDGESMVSSGWSAEESAVAVHDFLLANCNVDLGPVATIVSHGPVAPAGTAPATSTG